MHDVEGFLDVDVLLDVTDPVVVASLPSFVALQSGKVDGQIGDAENHFAIEEFFIFVVFGLQGGLFGPVGIEL